MATKNLKSELLTFYARYGNPAENETINAEDIFSAELMGHEHAAEKKTILLEIVELN